MYVGETRIACWNGKHLCETDSKWSEMTNGKIRPHIWTLKLNRTKLIVFGRYVWLCHMTHKSFVLCDAYGRISIDWAFLRSGTTTTEIDCMVFYYIFDFHFDSPQFFPSHSFYAKLLAKYTAELEFGETQLPDRAKMNLLKMSLFEWRKKNK